MANERDTDGFNQYPRVSEVPPSGDSRRESGIVETNGRNPVDARLLRFLMEEVERETGYIVNAGNVSGEPEKPGYLGVFSRIRKDGPGKRCMSLGEYKAFMGQIR